MHWHTQTRILATRGAAHIACKTPIQTAAKPSARRRQIKHVLLMYPQPRVPNVLTLYSVFPKFFGAAGS
jgi:hypothetical protein